MAERIQRKRTKGWKKPEGAVYVGRGSKWGNPWVIGGATVLTGKRAGEKINAKETVSLYRSMAMRLLQDKPQAFEDLAGKDLMCWCPLNEACHADVLLELANGGGKP